MQFANLSLLKTPSLLALALALSSSACLAQENAGKLTTDDFSTMAFRDCEVCPQMVRVPDEVSDQPLSFSVYELTWAEYAHAVDEAGCRLPQAIGGEPIEITSEVCDDHPMSSIPPDDIGCYLDWLSGVSGHTYRLPTEAEWQAVANLARADATAVKPPVYEKSYSLDPRQFVRFRSIRSVGGQYHSALGMYDLFGGVREVVTSPRNETDWIVVRGGSDWENDELDRLNDWRRVPAKGQSITVGFRLAREGN